jgi:hypothetical protein
MNWNESNEGMIFENHQLSIVTNVFKHYIYLGRIFKHHIFGGCSLNTYLHNNILQHHFGSNLIVLNFKQNIPSILLWKHCKINSHLRKQPWFLLTCLKIASTLSLGDKDYHL